MSNTGRLLIADDEETFLMSTAELLRKEGYECDCARDAASAARMLRSGDHDLLIADIKMPGNLELEFIKDMPQLAQGLPVILVTGYPTLDTAIKSIQLQVVGYLTKPIDFDELLVQVRDGIKSYQIYRSARIIRERIIGWSEHMTTIEEALGKPSQSPDSTSVDAFLELTFKNIVEIISDLKHLSKTFAAQNVPPEVCHLFQCPRLTTMAESVKEAIYVLHRTKSSFKSKELARLRMSLEQLIKDMERPDWGQPKV
jgi:CheY-like chemotaxis protein